MTNTPSRKIPPPQQVRLGDICEVFIGARASAGASKRVGTTRANVRLITGRDLFSESPFGEKSPSDVVLYNDDPTRFYIRKGDLLLPVVSRNLRLRLVDGAEEDCIAHDSVTVLRPRAQAPPTAWFANLLSSKEFLDAARGVASSLGENAIRLTARAVAAMAVVWRAETQQPENGVAELMDRLVRDLIRVIAHNAEELRYVPWRILEELLATAFAELGFVAELTPPSKDGGKDIILECHERGARKRYIVEVKHWACGKPVPGQHLKRFLRVIINEQHDSGLILSTSGFAQNALESVVHLEQKRIRTAGRDKVLKLCELYVKRSSGLWIGPQSPTEALFEHTSGPTH
jgi:hypothetical protein